MFLVSLWFLMLPNHVWTSVTGGGGDRHLLSAGKACTARDVSVCVKDMHLCEN
jgi:hypothetical protein